MPDGFPKGTHETLRQHWPTHSSLFEVWIYSPDGFRKGGLDVEKLGSGFGPPEDGAGQPYLYNICMYVYMCVRMAIAWSFTLICTYTHTEREGEREREMRTDACLCACMRACVCVVVCV